MRSQTSDQRRSRRPARLQRRRRLRASSTIWSSSRSAMARWYASACSSGTRWVRRCRRGRSRSRSIDSSARRRRSRIMRVRGLLPASSRTCSSSSRRSRSSESGISRRPRGVVTVEMSPLSSHRLSAGWLMPRSRAASAGRTVGPARLSRNSSTGTISSRSSGAAFRAARRSRKTLVKSSGVSNWYAGTPPTVAET
jgi:hypothetical protein